MDKKSFEKYVEKMFTYNILPNLMNFIRIPNLSPAYDYNWNSNGYLLKAANLIVSFAKSLEIKNAQINLIQDKGYTPLIYIEIPASRQNDTRTVLLYAHFDKQPYGTGWDEDKQPTNPVIIDNHLYGRGSADDGYASFSILTAIKACQDHNCPLPRICIIFEGAEESTDEDLTYYFNKLMPAIGNNVIAFIPLDSGCSDYGRLWITNSLRGVVDFDINIQTLDNDCNYGPEASGRIAENLFLLRKALDGVMDTTTGDIKIDECYVKDIPKEIEEEMDKEIEIVGDTFFDDIPLYDGVKPLKSDVKEAMINNRWKPSFIILGMDNCPKIEDNAFGVSKSMKIRMSMRLPPGVDSQVAMNAVNNALKENTYFGAKVGIGFMSPADGWVLTNLSDKTKTVLNKASLEYFGNEMVFKGVGGSIPFISYFQSKYPNADIICTGILGADSHEHGTNENLNIDACKKMILILCYFLSEI
jgi:acetylornithine deacetylase/succinyl-diaminopimelate desuccinylase-like protein